MSKVCVALQSQHGAVMGLWEVHRQKRSHFWSKLHIVPDLFFLRSLHGSDSCLSFPVQPRSTSLLTPYPQYQWMPRALQVNKSGTVANWTLLGMCHESDLAWWEGVKVEIRLPAVAWQCLFGNVSLSPVSLKWEPQDSREGLP